MGAGGRDTGGAALMVRNPSEEGSEFNTVGSHGWLLIRGGLGKMDILGKFGSGRQDSYKSIILIMELVKSSRILKSHYI